MIRAGPVGSKVAGYSEVEWNEKGRTMISNIYVSYSKNLITSIQFGYLEKGVLVLSKKFGPSDGHNLRVVTLKQDEYVTGLTGVLALSLGIKILTFHTNLGKHGPIGILDGDYADDPTIEIDPAIHDRCEFDGFFGSYNGSNLSSIGMYVNPTARSDEVVKSETFPQATPCSSLQQKSFAVFCQNFR
ncbi:unnamed protein product [Microthlaspi erraticum]|uniref:Jacalin-type lectin domain-containing protein n=1 Tax=Microthlaspi erraticum TaxID=1685480 RepID=A0A6D2KT64_9BRAS|nr:unnamed protein product [Microthlaspi erraticum]CAA7058547.1 unnamed protein product [Microthlaspi erraticum]